MLNYSYYFQARAGYVFTTTLKTHARNLKKANKSPTSNLCHIMTCFEVIRGFSQFLQALVDAGPLEQDTDALLMYEGWNFNSGNYLFTIDTK